MTQSTHDGPLRVGVIGVGMMGADHAERIAHRVANAQLVAVADPDQDRATRLAAAFDDVRVFADPLDLVADAGVDAVVIASPGFVHEEQVLACLQHGTFALCEKPLTMDAQSSLRLVEAERRAARPLVQVGFMRRFDPEYAAMKAMLDSGDLGRLLLVHNVHRNKSAPEGFRSEMIVRDSLVHEVDVCRWLFGEEIVEITVHSPTATSNAAEGVVDPQLAVFRMAGGGMATSEVFVNCTVGYEVRCEASAERGNATVGLGSGPLVRSANRWGGAVPDDFRVRFAAAYDAEVQSWVDACRRGEVVGPTTWDGHAATVVCEAGMESLRSGSPMKVELS
jgi:myo-inositol 2-dehydrogenase / D-chiro-inositol 1-dehydrogenase